MNVSLTKELENYVSGLFGAGQYGSASEVVREALRLHIRDQWERSIERRAAIGQAEADMGLGIEATDAFFDGLRTKIATAGV